MLQHRLPGAPTDIGQRPHHGHQAVVALRRQLGDRAPAGLLVGLFDDPVDERRRQLGDVGELRPRPGEGRTELLDEVAHAGRPAGQPVHEERAHRAPPQPGAVADGVVDLSRGRHAVVHQPERLPPERLEQAVGHEPVHLARQHERLHADGAVRGGRPLDRLRRGAGAATDLDQRQQVDGVERVADHQPLRVSESVLERAREQPGRRRGDHDVGSGDGVGASEQLALHVEALRRALLDEVDADRRVLGCGHDVQRAGRGQGDADETLQRAAGDVDDARRLGAGLRVGVVEQHVGAVGDEPPRPAGADDPAAEQPDAGRAAAALTARTQGEAVADLGRSLHAHVHRLEDAHGAGDEVGVRGQLARPGVQVVLQPDAHVAAGEHGHGHERQLHAADRERREHGARGQQVDHRQQRRRVVGRPVGDAHAQLHEHGVVDQAVGEQLAHHHEVAGVEHLQLGTDTELLHLPGHRAQHARRVDHDVVAARGEVHRPAVEGADLRLQGTDVVEAFGRAGHVGAGGRHRQRCLVAAEHEVASHAGGQVDHDVDVGVADPFDDLGVELGGAGADAGLGIAHVDVDDGRTGAGGVERRGGDLGRGHRHVRALRRRVAGAGDRTGDEGVPVHGVIVAPSIGPE